MAWIKDETLIERRKFIDYIHGLIRYEVSHNDDDKRLEVLSKIYYDMVYTENLENANDWKKSIKGKSDYDLVLDKLQKVTAELNKYKEKDKEVA